ncbi:TPA: hypothetical protein N0F65_001733 [Lagenidium giganteum]|uniref:LNR domain-containing protein n=1 Tax=Lagenidium giganteum TaxID=4803 RepID=A0AAV2Z5W7_9STRA|nr:TPA: hypothetical protein N0F65_001733 [Lagenidium giganteum]
MENMSARSRRAIVDDDQDQGGGRLNRLLALLTAVLAAACAFLYVSRAPEDRDNIGHIRADEFLSYGPIDVVYTWVNGTDPRWKAEKEYWHKHWIASLTGQPLPKKRDDTVVGKDTANADNRFRDNEELRYSLRSLEKYAPWIRHVYVVTDGQIPSWLDIECPKVSIIKHRDIFENSSHLPVFSSPAIEWNLDNIPGLSDNFLYFNDDVFLGSKVHPEDFISQKGVQKVYLAWEIPLCAQGCWDFWLQNGRCDKGCNVTACDFDMGDCGCDVDVDGNMQCDPVKIASIQEAAPKPPKISDHICSGACHFRWIGDNTCDPSCNITTCGFDGGDCGMNLFDQLHTVDVRHNETLVEVPLAANATYLNLTRVFGVNGTVTAASHDNDQLIRHATVFETEMKLLFVFGRDEDGDPMTNSALVSVVGTDVNGTVIELEFALTRGSKWISSDFDGGFYTYKNSSIKPRHVKLPFGFRHAEFKMAKWAQPKPTPAPGAHGQIIDTAPVVEKQPPLMEMYLPFNVTKKALRHGEVVVVAMEAQFRLHDAVQDYWANAGLECQVHIPREFSEDRDKPKLLKSAATSALVKSPEKDATGTPSESPSTSGEAAAVEGDSTPTSDTPTTEAVKADTGSSQSSDVVTITFDMLEESKSDKLSADAQTLYAEKEPEPFRPGIPVCQVVDGKGILMRVYLPTPVTRTAAEPEVAPTEVPKQPAQVPSPLPIDPDTRSPVEVPPKSAPAPVAKKDKPKPPPEPKPDVPQVLDGKICFKNAEEMTAKRYCFTIAIGSYYPHYAFASYTPPVVAPPKVVYQPYLGEESALIELESSCIDTTLRELGLRPRDCKAVEVPHPIVIAAEEEKARQDPAHKNAEEGRRLACEAKKRRMEEQERLEEEAELRRKRGGASIVVIDYLVNNWNNLKDLLNLHVVEETFEDIEDVEYEDVCKPYFHDPEASAQITAANAEALLSNDTFGDSLRYVNKLYNRVFGKAQSRRRVPSHMPFMLQKKIIREIKTRWRKEYDATSAHRFRHPNDFQFSFSYFHYLMNRNKINPPTLEFIWKEYLDANRNGILDENEVLTVASLAYGDYPSDAFVEEVRTCLQPPKQEKVMEKSTAQGSVLVAETLTPHITFESLAACTETADKLIKNVRKEKMFELMPEDEVTFHMLSDQYRYAWNQMLGTRARRTKFVCINDDMKYPNPSVSQILHELFLAIWPKRSQFELPYHLKNRFTHIDDYNLANERRNHYIAGGCVIVLLLFAFFWSDLKALFGFQEIARARRESASALSADLHREQEEDDDDDNHGRRRG